MRVTIIGAGIIGLSIAWELARRGASVRVVERGAVGRGTSWAAAGILPAARRDTASDPQERLRGLSHELYPQWTQTLARISGIDSGLQRCGGIYLASSAGEAASLLAGLDYQHDLQIDVSRLTREQLAIDEPALATWAMSKRFKAALISPDEYQIRPPDHLASLAVACRVGDVQIDEHSIATLVFNSGEVKVRIQNSSGNEALDDADRIIVCGGAWSGQIAAQLGLANSIIPIRGQMLLYRFPIPPLRRIVNEGHRYLVPRADGRLLVGSCEEEVGFEKATTAEILEPLARWAESVLPELVGMTPERSWSALRPATFDGFPLIGKAPGMANLYLAAGHYRSGIHLAPATAMVIADLLLETTPVVDIGAFNVGRLIGAVTASQEPTASTKTRPV